MLDDLTELPEGWEETTLGEIILPYETAQPQKHPESEYRYIDIGSIDNSNQTIVEAKVFLGKDAPSRARRIVKEGDVLFSTVRTYLKNIARVSSDFDGILTSTGIAILRASEIVEPNYLFHYVISEEFLQKISSTMDGTLYPAINDSDLLNAFIPLPPLNEQKRIVAKIEELRSHTQAARNAIAHIPKLLEQFRQSVLAAAFRGDLTAEWRSEKRIRKERLLGNRLTSSDTDLPSKWLWSNAIECCERVIDCHNKTAPYRKSGIKLVRTSNIRSGSINTEETMFVDQETYDYWSRRCPPQPGDILFTREAPMAEVGMIPENEKLCMGQRMMLLRPDNSNLLGVYLLFVLQSPYIKDYVERIAVGTGVKHLRVKDVEGLPIPLSPLLEQKVITEKLLSYIKIIDRIEQQYQFIKTELDRLDRSILAKAFKGELVPQDPADEAAIMLLERIRGDRASQIKSIKIKRKKHSV
ncbi:MAG: restriction endonuclease subunit S [Cyanobacteria bacterium]|nr:restriction endonuclease subunit S [Cyanobacteriota bacterium]